MYKRFVDEVFDELAIPRSFMFRPRRIMEDELDFMEDKLDFGSPRQPPRRVRAKFVSCNRPSAAIEVITRPDPVGTIQAANTCAIKLLDYVINELQATRKKIVAGAAPASTVADEVNVALDERFHMDANDRNIWTGRGRRSVYVLIRRLRGARQILADGWMKYTCVGGPDFPLGNCRASCTPPKGLIRHAVTCPGHSRIVLCAPWWSDHPDGQAGTLLHEALHIYFGSIGDTGIFANAHIYEQFVRDLTI
jgi:hypothetical protein